MTSAPSPEAASEREARVRVLERQRASGGARAFAWALAFPVVGFFAFSVGSLLGPVPLARQELMGGAMLSLALGLVVQALTVRRATEHDARFVGRLREGGRWRRVAVFADHFWIDDGVALRPVRAVQLEADNTLRLAFTDRDGAEVARTFSGTRQVLARLRDEIARDLGETAPAPDAWVVGRSGLRG